MNEKPHDDLTVIKGIGPVWQKRLQESLGVYTFQDLAVLSSDEIISGLKPAPSKSECEAWISQAQELVIAAKLSAETEEGSQQTNSPTGSAEWKPIASFVIEFLSRATKGETEQRRTKAHHLETDKNANWPGIENVELCRWMLEQMGETALSELEQQIEESRVRAQYELEQELDNERTQARKDLEQERTQAMQALERELEEKRTQAQLELERLHEEEQARTRQALQKELDDKRTQARKDLEQELDQIRTQTLLEFEQKVEEEYAQVQEDLKPEPMEEEPKTLVAPLVKEPQSRPKMEKEFGPPAQPSESRPAREPHSTLAITQLRAFQPIDVAESVGIGIPGRPFSGFINGDELFTFVVDFELAEPAMSEITQQEMTYQAQFYVRDLLTGAKEHLGNTKANPLVEGISTYIARLTDVTLESGIYELTVLVTIQNRASRANYLMVPLLQIV